MTRSVVRVSAPCRLLTKDLSGLTVVVDAQYVATKEFSPWLYNTELPIPHLITLYVEEFDDTIMIRMISRLNQPVQMNLSCLDNVDPEDLDERRSVWSRATRIGCYPNKTTDNEPCPMPPTVHPCMFYTTYRELMRLFNNPDVVKVGPELSFFGRCLQYHFNTKLVNFFNVDSIKHINPQSELYIPYESRIVADHVMDMIVERSRSMLRHFENAPDANNTFRDQSQYQDENRRYSAGEPVNYHQDPPDAHSKNDSEDHHPPPLNTHRHPPPLCRSDSHERSVRQVSRESLAEDHCNGAKMSNMSRSIDETNNNYNRFTKLDPRRKLHLEIGLLLNAVRNADPNNPRVAGRLEQYFHDLHAMVIELKHLHHD